MKELLAGRDVIAILSTGKSRKKFKNYHMYNLRHVLREYLSGCYFSIEEHCRIPNNRNGVIKLENV